MTVLSLCERPGPQGLFCLSF